MLTRLLLFLFLLPMQAPQAPQASQTPKDHQAPGLYYAKFDTSAGTFVFEVHRDWSPHAADRFFELVQSGYYNNSRFFRVVPGKWAQFGIAGDPAVAQKWRSNTFADDTLVQHNTAGFVGFSNTAANTRSTQIYINTGDNHQNDSAPAFAPFAKVIDGMDVVNHLYGEYGEHSGGGMRAGHQDEMFTGGNAYLDKEFPKLDKIIKVSIVKWSQTEQPH